MNKPHLPSTYDRTNGSLDSWMELVEHHLANFDFDKAPPEIASFMAKRYVEEWDRRLSSPVQIPLATLIQDFGSIPCADEVHTEQEAQRLLEPLLDQLADHNIIVETCEHVSSHNFYRYLTEEIIAKSNVNSRLIETGVVEYFYAFDNCQECRSGS